MTIIAAYENKDGVWIASDSRGSTNFVKWDLGTKLIYEENYTIGNAGSYRTFDLIRECNDFPEQIRDLDDLREFRDNLREIMLEDGGASEAQGPETLIHSVDIIIVSPAGIFDISNDYQIHQIQHGYAACGSGTELALGSMITFKNTNQTDGYEAVRLACEAAIAHSCGCGGDIYIDGWERD